MIFYADFHCALGFCIAPTWDRFISNFRKIQKLTWKRRLLRPRRESRSTPCLARRLGARLAARGTGCQAAPHSFQVGILTGGPLKKKAIFCYFWIFRIFQKIDFLDDFFIFDPWPAIIDHLDL